MRSSIPDDLIERAFDAVASLDKANCFGDPTDAQKTMTVLQVAADYTKEKPEWTTPTLEILNLNDAKHTCHAPHDPHHFHRSC